MKKTHKIFLSALVVIAFAFIAVTSNLPATGKVAGSGNEFLYTKFEAKSIGMPLPLLNTEGIDAKDTSIGRQAPDFTLTDVDGNKFRLSDFKGKPVILDFMATWCGMTAREMDAYRELSAEYADEIQIVSIDTYKIDSDNELRLYRDRYKSGGPNWIYAIDKDDNIITLTYGVDKSVSTFILDRDGRISYKDNWITGYETLKEEIEKVL